MLVNKIDLLSRLQFVKLAQLRNLALKLMLKDPKRYSNATIIFLNNVIICPDDILKLIYQQDNLSADITCAIDWVYRTDTAIFYDVYIARGINRDLFFDVLLDVSWSKATNLFWNKPKLKAQFDARQPVQVFACQNSAVAFAAEPLVS